MKDCERGKKPFRYPRQNGLAVALRELGRIERSLFTLDWLRNVELRRRVPAGLKLPRQRTEPGDGGHRAVE